MECVQELLTLISKAEHMVVGYVHEEGEHLHSCEVDAADHGEQDEHGQEQGADGGEEEDHDEEHLLLRPVVQLLNEVARGVPESDEEVIVDIVSNEVNILLHLIELCQIEVVDGEDSAGYLEDSLCQRELERLQGVVLLFEVKSHCLVVDQLGVRVREGETGETDVVLQRVERVQGRSDVRLRVGNKVRGSGVVLVSSELALVNENQVPDIVSDSLHFRDD
jgi:hypothetical protein